MKICKVCGKEFIRGHFFVRDIVGYSDYQVIVTEYKGKICNECIRTKIKEMRELKL